MITFIKKYLFVSVLSVIFSLGILGAANASYMLDEFAKPAGYDIGPKQTVESKISLVINVALSIVGLLFLGMAMYAGMRWLTARGNEENVTKARDALEGAIIGMVIIAVSYAISSMIFNLVSAKAAPPTVNSPVVSPEKLKKCEDDYTTCKTDTCSSMVNTPEYDACFASCKLVHDTCIVTP